MVDAFQFVPYIFAMWRLALAFLVTACAGTPVEQPTEQTALDTPTRVYEGDACAARLASFVSTLESLPVDITQESSADFAHATHGTQPVTSTAQRLEVAADGSVRLDGVNISVEELSRRFEEIARNWASYSPNMPYPGRIRVIASASTRLSVLAPVLDGLGTAPTVELLVDTGRRRTLPTMPPWVERRVTATDPSERMQQLVGALSLATEGCPAIRVSMMDLDGADRENRAAQLRQALRQGLEQCRCGRADIDAIEAVVSRMFTMPSELGVLVIRGGEARNDIAVPRSGTVADLARVLEARQTMALPMPLHVPTLYIRHGDRILEAPAADQAVAQRYPTLRDEERGPIVRGLRLTLLTDRRSYATGDEVRVIHIVEVDENHEAYVMGPKPVVGEFVDGRARTPAPPVLEYPWTDAYDGRVIPGPALDASYDITSYRFDEPGRHVIVWQIGEHRSNELVIEVR
jgi:hypothetical protein